MDPKDTKKLEALWKEHCELDLRPGDVPAFEAKLRNAQQRYEDFAQARKDRGFAAAYDGNHLLHAMGKEESRRFFDDTCATHGFPLAIDELLAIGIHRHIREHTQLLYIRSAHSHVPVIDVIYDCRAILVFLNSLLDVSHITDNVPAVRWQSLNQDPLHNDRYSFWHARRWRCGRSPRVFDDHQKTSCGLVS
jgi:hypothetical protein